MYWQAVWSNGNLYCWYVLAKGCIINSDTIGRAIGSILLDDSEVGELDIISTASSVLNQSEQLYTTWEKKFREIFCVLQLFRIYFYGRNLIIYTDNKALEFLRPCDFTSNRVTSCVIL
jgi:hypothetical protein